jgi:WD40 repeat protein
MTLPLEHHGPVHAASFSPDGTRVVTASDDKTAQIWPLSVDNGSLADWRLLARCSPFALIDTVLTANPDPIRVCPATATSNSPR